MPAAVVDDLSTASLTPLRRHVGGAGSDGGGTELESWKSFRSTAFPE